MFYGTPQEVLAIQSRLHTSVFVFVLYLYLYFYLHLYLYHPPP